MSLDHLKEGKPYAMLGLKGEIAPWEKEVVALDGGDAKISSPLG